MPTFDGGHYFLTVLAPIRTDQPVDLGGGAYRSHAQVLRDTLACLPTARQSPPTVDSPLNSPFARSRRTHLARFVVIDDVVFNGRRPADAIRNRNPALPQPVDRLTTPYLLFAADFDAAGGDDAALRRYLTELWDTMEAELRAVFGHCVGFDRVTGAAAFCDYVKRCQIETTMPFNDYWTKPIPATDMSLLTLLAPAGASAFVFTVALLCWIVRADHWLLGWPWGWIALAGLAATAASLWWAYRRVMTGGEQPFPAAPDSDLPSVLKALYLQQRFVAFATANQGAEPAALHQAFGAFLDAHKPGDLDSPTQPPGVIRS